MVIAIITVLAAILLPTLVKAKEAGKKANCISNQRQLQLCWLMYAGDYGDTFVPNDSIDTIGAGYDGEATNSWCGGQAEIDTNTIGITSGLLFPYNRSFGIYHCPADISQVVENGVLLPILRNRSYNMSQSVNGNGFMIDPDSGYPVDAIQPCFSKLSAITNPPPSRLFVFIDENELTLQDAQFGYPIPPLGYPYWWDMPSNRHDQGANLSFVDGHVEYWHWKVPMLGNNTFPQWVPQAQIPDYLRVGAAMRMLNYFNGQAN